MKTLVLITARAGSKSVPDKNILRFGDDTALSLRIKSAKAALPGADIIVSTDSEVYAKLASAAGAQVPFIRPKQLAEDTTSSLDVIRHAIDFLKNGGKSYDFFILAEPSSPFCRPEDVTTGLSLLQKTDGPVVSVREVSPHPIFVAPLGPNQEFGELGRRLAGDLRRQAFAKNYTPNGCFYGDRVNRFLKNGTFYVTETHAFVMPDEYSIEIDEPKDALYAQWLWDTHTLNQHIWKLL